MRSTIQLFVLLMITASSVAAEWRVEAYGGVFFPGSSDLTISRPSAGDEVTYRRLDWDGRSLDSPIYYGYRVARFQDDSSRWGVELELIHAKVYADPDSRPEAEGRIGGEQVNGPVRLGDHVQDFSISHGANQLLANLVYRRGLNSSGQIVSGKPYLSLRTGIGTTIAHTESIIDGEARGQYQFSGFAFQGAAGLVLPLWRRIFLPLEYKYSVSWLEGLKVNAGSAKCTVGGSHLTAGLGVHF